MPDPNNIALRGHGVVFMCLPKVANTSIKVALAKAFGKPCDPQTIHQADLFEYVSKAEAKSFAHRIAFVRDPLSRLASGYQDKIVEMTDGRFLDGLREHFSPGMDFLKFIERLAEISDEDLGGAGQHFRSQSFDLCEGDEMIPNWIGRFENIEHDWAELRGYLLAAGLELPPLTCERSTTSKPNYCPRGRAFAMQRYKEDVRLFGYRRPYKYEIDPDGITVGRSICNVIREAYQIAREVEEPAVAARLTELLAEAFDMGKRMNAKLQVSQYE